MLKTVYLIIIGVMILQKVKLRRLQEICIQVYSDINNILIYNKITKNIKKLYLFLDCYFIHCIINTILLGRYGYEYR